MTKNTKLKPKIEKLYKEMLMEHFSTVKKTNNNMINTNCKYMKNIYILILNNQSVLTAIADINVKTIMARAIIVAIILEEENIFFICFRGPIRKHVLQINLK